MTTEYEIGQKVVYQNTVCTVCKPENNEGSWGYWIDNPERGYKHGVSKDSIKPYGAEPIEYKPDWDSIPKEFKYCYVDPNNTCKVILTTMHSIPLASDCTECVRPPALVDGA